MSQPAEHEKRGIEAIRKTIAHKGWLKSHKWLLLRRLVQLGTLGLFLLGPLAGIWIIKGNLASSLILDTVPMTEPLLILQSFAAGMLPLPTALLGGAIVVVGYLLVGGRVYCAWICPVNIITDVANWMREKQGINASTHLTRRSRYWILAMVLVLPLFTGTMAYEVINPVPMVHRAIIFGAGSAWSILLAIFLFDLLIQRRGWCGYLCPMGALYSIIGRNSPLRIRADRRDSCDDCMACYQICPEPQVIKPALKGEDQKPVIFSAACSNCGRCIDVCDKDVFNFGGR